MKSIAVTKAKPIDALTLVLGKWIRRFNPENPKAVAKAEATICPVCCESVKLARIVPFQIKAKFTGWAHYACAPWIHPATCLCLPCRNRRIRASKPILFSGITKKLPPQNMEQLLGQKERVKGFGAKLHALKYCACSHDGPSHKEDEVGNLLACQVSGCRCDHFHYASDAVSAAAR